MKCAYCNKKTETKCAKCQTPICPDHTVIAVDMAMARICIKCVKEVSRNVADRDERHARE